MDNNFDDVEHLADRKFVLGAHITGAISEETRRAIESHETLRREGFCVKQADATPVLHLLEAGHTLGDYPNAANIREWMRVYFGRSTGDTTLRCTYLYVKRKLPDIQTPGAAIRFGLALGFSMTDAGRDKAFALGILSDDSPAVPLPVGAVQNGKAAQAETAAGDGISRGKAIRKPGPSRAQEKLRQRIYKERQKHIAATKGSTQESWEKWIPGFLKKLPNSMHSTSVSFQNNCHSKFPKELSTDEWKNLYSAEVISKRRKSESEQNSLELDGVEDILK